MKTLIAILLLAVACNSVKGKDPEKTSFLDLGNPVVVTKPAVINDKDKTLYRSILTGVEAEILKAKLPAGDQPHGPASVLLIPQLQTYDATESLRAYSFRLQAEAPVQHLHNGYAVVWESTEMLGISKASDMEETLRKHVSQVVDEFVVAFLSAAHPE
jgi:hypothetical protein